MQTQPATLQPTYQPNLYDPSIFGKGTRLVYGTAGLGGVWGKVDEAESIDCLLYAFENGVSTLDTSPSYHMSEVYVGKALRRWQGTLPFVSTKVGRLSAEKADECYVDYSPEAMRASLMRSLDRLGVSQVDLLFLHEPQLVPLENIAAILDTLQSFKQEGLVRMLGVGGNPTDQFRSYVTSDHFQVVSGFLKMNACNLSAFEKDIPHFQQQGIAYYAAASLHMGLLGNRYDAYVARPPHTEWITDQDIATAQAVHDIAKQYNMPLSALAQRYLFSIREANRVVIGASNMQQLKASLSDWQQGVLPMEVFNTLTQTILTHRKLMQ